MGRIRETIIDNTGEVLYKCSICKRFRVFERFDLRSDTPNCRLRSECKDCRNLESKLYHRIAKKNMTLLDAQKSILHREKLETDVMYKYRVYMIVRTRSNAAKKGIEFSLTVEDVIIPEFCPILKEKLNTNSFKYTPSIDRLDNNLGYHKDNIRVISRLANIMKNCASNEELKIFAENIIDYIKI